MRRKKEGKLFTKKLAAACVLSLFLGLILSGGQYNQLNRNKGSYVIRTSHGEVLKVYQKNRDVTDAYRKMEEHWTGVLKEMYGEDLQIQFCHMGNRLDYMTAEFIKDDKAYCLKIKAGEICNKILE